MAHFAQIDNDNKVLQVIVVNNQELLNESGNEDEQKGIDFAKNLFGGKWLQTSYNANFRGKYAGIGDTYNEEEDIFIVPQPYPSWTRIGSFWKAPIDMPTDGAIYGWDESKQCWNKHELFNG